MVFETTCRGRMRGEHGDEESNRPGGETAVPTVITGFDGQNVNYPGSNRRRFVTRHPSSCCS